MRPQERAASSCVHWLPSISATPRSILATALSFACVFSLTFELPANAAIPAAAKDKKKADPALKGLPITELSSDEAILHALNRLAYGPRPGDIERVRQMGLAKWIEQQLNPNSIDDKPMEARMQDYPSLRMSTAKLIDEYPQPKRAEKQAEKQAQAQARQEQRRSDAAAETVARDTQEAQGQTKSGSDAEAAKQTTANPRPDMSDAPAPMKQEQPEGNPVTRCGLLLSSAIARGTLLGAPAPKTSPLPAPFVPGFPSGCSCFMGGGASLMSGLGFAVVCLAASASLPLLVCPCASCVSRATVSAAASERRCSCRACACACFSACFSAGLGCGYSSINFAVDIRSDG